jgi:small subunit ribosomal protein S13
VLQKIYILVKIFGYFYQESKMARVVGVDIPDNKKIEVSLTYIYGIGPSVAKEIIEKLKLNPITRTHQLTADDIGRMNALIQSDYVVEGDLRRQVQNNIKRLVGIHCYRGIRHRLGLPVRGQRTRTNARTRKGPRKTVAGKKAAPKM